MKNSLIYCAGRIKKVPWWLRRKYKVKNVLDFPALNFSIPLETDVGYWQVFTEEAYTDITVLWCLHYDGSRVRWSKKIRFGKDNWENLTAGAVSYRDVRYDTGQVYGGYDLIKYIKKFRLDYMQLPEKGK